MKLVLFDLGRTLEDNDILLPGAVETLVAIENMRDANDEAPVLGLVSDFPPASTPQQVAQRQQEYYAILDLLGIRAHFEPVAERVTLSTEVGISKPDERIFRAAIDRIESGAGFGQAIFITEVAAHVNDCRTLGMRAIHFQGPGQTAGEIDQLRDAIPLIKDFVAQT